MYDNEGFFCCEQGKKGYANHKTNGDGCGDQDYKLGDYEEFLTIEVSGRGNPRPKLFLQLYNTN